MELREYQKEDVKFILNHPECGVFSEQRVGKTPTVISAMAQSQLKKWLVICPASIVRSWEHEVKLWSSMPVEVPDSTSDSIDRSYNGVIIVNYEKIRGKKSKLIDELTAWNPQGVVVDEAHRMKDRKSLTYIAISKFKKAQRRIAITGTPCTNKPWDVWSILNWLKPRVYTSYWNFINDYFIQQPIYFGGRVAHQPIAFRPGKDRYLQAQLSMFCIQRKRNEVMSWLNEIEPEDIPLKPSVSEATIISELEKWYEYKHIICKTQLDQMIRIRQICNDARILNVKSKSTKTEWLKQYIKDYGDEENILIFSNSKKYLTLIQAELQIPIICGDTSIEERKQIIEKFQKEGGIVLCQTQSCKEGITLDNADTTIFMDVYPPSSDYQQAKDRMVATTPERNKPKKLLRVYLEGTLDEQCYNAVDHNIELTEFINSYAMYLAERKNNA